MAKRRSRSGERDTNIIANTDDPLSGLLLRPFMPPLVTESLVDPLDGTLEDRRLFHPDQDFRPALSLFGPSEVRAVVSRGKASRLSFQTPHRIGFSEPRQVHICRRRKERREVLFAHRKTGQGARARRHRHNRWSDVRC